MTPPTSRALLGVALSAGAPLGWLTAQALGGDPIRHELADHPGLYLYMLVGTAVVFGLFGLLLGDREARLLDSNRQLEELSITDALTGLRNARYFHSRLEEEWAESERSGKPLAVAVIDLDHFKKVNDRYGHQVGDAVLVAAARAIAATTRREETEARVGGEEFALLLPNSTGAEASAVVERIREAIGASEARISGLDGETVRVTASAGVASTAESPGTDMRGLYRAADEALYRAKREGRNRTIVGGAVD